MSGVTANTAMGAVSDWIVEKGGTVIFGENTEMIGTDHILARRAKNAKVAEGIFQMVNRADKLANDIMGNMAGLVISPGNMDGGMSTIAEKSMGCIFKGGSTTINQVVDYGEISYGKRPHPPGRSGLRRRFHGRPRRKRRPGDVLFHRPRNAGGISGLAGDQSGEQLPDL